MSEEYYSSSFDIERMKARMEKSFNIRCKGCGREFYLDKEAYADFTGEVPCRYCGRNNWVEFTSGKLKHIKLGDGRLPPEKVPDEIVSSTRLPEAIRTDFEEAFGCLASGFYKSSVVMCRRALESLTINLGAPKNLRLVDKVRFLLEKGVISQQTFDLATGIRQFGNYGAHPDDDLLEGITERDAEVIVGFTQSIIHDSYVKPELRETLERSR